MGRLEAARPPRQPWLAIVREEEREMREGQMKETMQTASSLCDDDVIENACDSREM
jgi:hypothetical protein